MNIIYAFCDGGAYHGVPSLFVSHDENMVTEPEGLVDRISSGFAKMNMRLKVVTFDGISMRGFQEEESSIIEECCKSVPDEIIIRHSLLYPKKGEVIPAYLRYMSFRSFLIQDGDIEKGLPILEEDAIQELRYRPVWKEVGCDIEEPFPDTYKKVFRVLHADFLPISGVIRFLSHAKQPWSVIHSRQLEVQV